MTSVGTNWSRFHHYRAERLHEPTTVDEVRRIVAAAPRIRALGSRHSFSDLADSTELISLAGLDSDIRIDAETETVSFSAGVRYGELGARLEAAGWALRNLASLPHITVAGAVATGTHGSGDHNGTLSRAVSGLELVTADGDLRTIAPWDSDFDGSIVALGALGVVTRLTLDIEPTFTVRQDVYEGLAWDDFLAHADAIFARAYSVSVFTGWTGSTVGSVWLKSRIGSSKPPASLYGALPQRTDLHPLDGVPATNTTPQGGVPGPWIDRLPHFRLEFTPSNGDEIQSEYLVPRAHAVAAIEAVRALSPRLAPHLHVSELRTMAADSFWLSGASETEALGIHFTWKFEPDAVLGLIPLVEEALAPFAARPHWGKVFSAPPQHLYPRLPDFVALAEAMDPTGKFRNEFLERNVFGG